MADSVGSGGDPMRRTKSQLVDEISELRQELAALKGEIDGHPKYTVRPAGTAVREADSDPQKFAERFDLALRATNSAIWDWGTSGWSLTLGALFLRQR